jgi:hypothetical protein
VLVRDPARAAERIQVLAQKIDTVQDGQMLEVASS